jgi:hypothetical protein
MSSCHFSRISLARASMNSNPQASKAGVLLAIENGGFHFQGHRAAAMLLEGGIHCSALETGSAPCNAKEANRTTSCSIAFMHSVIDNQVFGAVQHHPAGGKRSYSFRF